MSNRALVAAIRFTKQRLTTKTCVHNLYYSKQKRGTRLTCLFVNMKRSVEMSNRALVAAIRFTKQRENQEILSIICDVLFFFSLDPRSSILDPRPSILVFQETGSQTLFYGSSRTPTQWT